MSFMVRAKSSSVSPGKPTMKSEDRLIPGRAFFSRRAIERYSREV